MENNTENINDFSEKENNLGLSENTLNFLAEIAKWGKFLSIIGLTFIGIIIVMGISLWAIFSYFSFGSGSIYTMIYLIIICTIYFFPVLYLYRFSTQLKLALINKDNDLLESSFKNLKSLFRFMGILAIIMIFIYILLGMFFFFLKSLLFF